jgi:hypothetical protein
MKTLTQNQIKMISTVIHFYDHPWMAKKIIDEQVAKEHAYFSSDRMTEHFMHMELIKFQSRKDVGSKHPEWLLEMTFEQGSPVPDISMIPGQPSGFEYLVWQENYGP